MLSPEISIRLPGWVERYVAAAGERFASREERMGLAIELSRQNFVNASGGPFASAIFAEDGRLVSVGVNLVVSSGCSLFHAETVALALAQKALGRFDIGDAGKGRFELFSSTEPCVMCYGAVHWSGVSALACGARGEDAVAIGFDEGDKPPDWPASLERRGIRVERDLLRHEAAEVLRQYVAAGGEVYNPGGNVRSLA